MDRTDLDTILDRLRRATDAIGTNLVELEADPSYQALAHSSLTGATADRWDAAVHTIAELWHGFARLTTLLADADAAGNDEQHLPALLTGPSIELTQERVPVVQRELLTAGPSTTSCSADELRGRLDAYRALAFATGRAEDPTSADAYAAAHDALYHAPTALDAAERFVARYQELLATTEHEDPR
jgi:hypothetical protein